MDRIDELIARLDNSKFTCIHGTDDCVFVVKSPAWPISENERRPVVRVSYNGLSGFYEMEFGIIYTSSYGLLYNSDIDRLDPGKFTFTLDKEGFFIVYFKVALCPVLKKTWQNKREP